MPGFRHKFGLGNKHEDAGMAAEAFNDMPLLSSSDAHSLVEIHLRAGK
jgi:PHP family Zn ribbon phosphoesterase